MGRKQVIFLWLFILSISVVAPACARYGCPAENQKSQKVKRKPDSTTRLFPKD